MSDASPTYRGYRRQALYALVRLLESQAEPDLAFQPEGAEDLAVFQGDRLVEVVRVKDLTDDLTLSHLKPRKPRGFFARAAEKRRSNPDLRITLVHFGRLGAELRAAIDVDGPKRREAARKVSRLGRVAEAEALDVLGAIAPEPAAELDLNQRIAAQLAHGPTGIDPDAALELMMYWLFVASEQQAASRATSS